MIEAQETEREGRRPERTVYRAARCRPHRADRLAERDAQRRRPRSSRSSRPGSRCCRACRPRTCSALLEDRMAGDRERARRRAQRVRPRLPAGPAAALRRRERVPHRDARGRAGVHRSSWPSEIRIGHFDGLELWRGVPPRTAPPPLPARRGDETRRARNDGRTDAIEAVDLTKTYGKGVRALDGLSFSASAGHRLRAARPERRRQVDDDQDPHDAQPARQRQRARRRHRRARRPGARAPHDRRRRPEAELRPRRDRPREPRPAGSDLRRDGPTAEAARRRSCSSASTSTAAADRDRQDLLGRHAAQARHRARPAARAERAVPRRADDGARPRGARRDVERDQRGSPSRSS